MEVIKEGFNRLRDEVKPFLLHQSAIGTGNILIGDVECPTVGALVVVMNVQGHLFSSFSRLRANFLMIVFI